MTFRVRHLRLRAITKSRIFGTDISLVPGLNIIQAGNTSGKSTCLQAIIYALGLERSLGPQLEIPLPYAMRERIHERRDDEYEPVIQSYVELEIENKQGAVIAIHRDVVGGKDTKLIQTHDAPRLTSGMAVGVQRDFFVHDPGAALREDGFHTYLAKFIGWDLPQVPRFDGNEGPLYLEAVFPMFFVEQKRGWSATQGPFPTFLRIQDIARRVMEFLLDLEAGRIRRERAEIRRQISVIQQRWTNQRTVLEQRTGNLIRIRSLPAAPSAEFSQSSDVPIEILENEEWRPIATVIERAQNRIRELENTDVPNTSVVAPQIQADLQVARGRADELTALVEGLRNDFNVQTQEKRAVGLRLQVLEVDLKRNQDAVKLKRLGSQLGAAAGEHVCPTCHQDISNELLPTVATVGMALEENIIFVKSQIELYNATLASTEERLDEIRARYYGADEELRERQREIRGLRQALVQPAESPSRAVIEEIVRRQAFVDRLSSIREIVDGATDEFRALAAEWADLQDRLKRLAGDDLTGADTAKISSLQQRVQQQLTLYGFRSFQPNEIHLSRDNFRPLIYTREDDQLVEREISFEVSASDAIRLKWAYYLSLLVLAKEANTNHPGLVVFDEPGQQEMELNSLIAFLGCAATSAASDQQVIVGTSEGVDNLESLVRRPGVNLINFEGFILQPIPTR